jgi:hypothetical protein
MITPLVFTAALAGYAYRKYMYEWYIKDSVRIYEEITCTRKPEKILAAIQLEQRLSTILANEALLFPDYTTMRKLYYQLCELY